MNQKTLKILEFKQIVEQLADLTTTYNGRLLAEKLTPLFEQSQIENSWELIEELKTLSGSHLQIPMDSLGNFKEIFDRLKIDAQLSTSELFQIKKLLNVDNKLVIFFESLDSDNFSPQLVKLVNRLADSKKLNQQINTLIDDRGQIKDDASKELSDLTYRINKLQTDTKNKASDFVGGSKAKYLSERVVTIRTGRYTLPVKIEYKNQFPGAILDQSASGQTLYIEPAEISKLNNQIQDLQFDRQLEIIRLISEFAVLLKENLPNLINNLQVISELDFANAKNKLAEQLHANKPKLNNNKIVDLKQAFHPMIAYDIVVKNDLKIGGNFNTLIITGPNTGGKTISIKTLGLLQLMAQSGLWITADINSQVSIFENIFADIGDEQSIQENLSTFSSHLTNIIDILKNANDNSLVILDELGSGTDPSEGAALAIAIINQLRKIKSLNIISTHYPEIKIFADQSDDVENASMIFDVEELKPTYKLLMGVPGQSNALSIAKRLGLDQEIIDDALNLVDPKDRQMNDLIDNLVDERQKLIEQNNQLNTNLHQIELDKDKLNEQLNEIEKTKAKELLDAKQQANSIVARTKNQATKIIDEIRRERLNKNEQQLQTDKNQLDSLRQDESLERNRILRKAKKQKELHIGDDVFVEQYNQIGEIVSIDKNNQYQVQMGILKVTLDESEIEKRVNNNKENNPAPKVKVKKFSQKNISATIDIRGQRYEEAIINLQRYLDSAILNNLDVIEIIHGKGTGALRQAVTETLSNDRRVINFEFANPNGAGDGATIVNFK